MSQDLCGRAQACCSVGFRSDGAAEPKEILIKGFTLLVYEVWMTLSHFRGAAAPTKSYFALLLVCFICLVCYLCV